MSSPRHNFELHEWLKLFLLLSTVVTVVTGSMAWLFLVWSDWRFVPARVSSIEQRLSLMQVSPTPVVFSGRGIVVPLFATPDHIRVTYTLRRVITCPTTIRVRFFDHGNNMVQGRYSYELPSVLASVSEDFTAFSVTVDIPPDLQDGTYSYWPEIITSNCGVYNGIMSPPMSDPFVLERENG